MAWATTARLPEAERVVLDEALLLGANVNPAIRAAAAAATTVINHRYLMN